MKRFIRFENDRQVEVTTLPEKPSGDGWKAAPANFDSNKIYKLVSGKVEEVSAEELTATRLDLEKTGALRELSRIVDNARGKYIGESPAKQKCYELQEKAANAVTDNPESSLGYLIQPLASVRNISVVEMAELILQKSALANQKIIQAEAIEDEYQRLIENGTTVEEISDLLAQVATNLEGF